MRRTARTAMVLVATSALLAACAHIPDEKDQKFAQIQFDLAVQATHAGRIQEAVADLQEGLARDPDFAPAHNLLGLLYQLSLGRPKQAEEEYLKALQLKKNYSEAANNLGSLYLQTGHYAKAEKAFRTALANVLYPTPYLARGNLGWALYKQGKVDAGINEIEAAVMAQPKFCQGYRNLAILYRAKGKQARADAAVGEFVKHCPKQAEAQYEWGRVRLTAGDATGARAAFDRCTHLVQDGPLADSCTRLLNRVGGPLPHKTDASAKQGPGDGPDLTIPSSADDAAPATGAQGAGGGADAGGQ